MNSYVALLRGINAGVTVKMQTLKDIFENLGFQDVQTVLATGNVLFDSSHADVAKLEQSIEKAIKEALSYDTVAIVRAQQDIRQLVASDPFKNVEATPQMVPQATFLKATVTPDPDIQYPVRGKGYTMLGVTDHVVCSVVDLSGGTTPDLMAVLDKHYKKAVTTRNWKTVQKIATKIQAGSKE